MKLFVASLLIWVAIWTSALAQFDGVQDVISRQIEAFKVDDVSTAFTFASPVIQRKFGNPTNFGLMVRKGYPMVWRPENVQFLKTRTIAGQIYQRILITDVAGQIHVLDYHMVKISGVWRINGVFLLDGAAESA
ncbi:MAG: DUF4864 domain-containing protein [Aestuariivita sp.]|nr:DUF4864 domain-containing protein [Aestuariivita sp.]